MGALLRACIVVPCYNEAKRFDGEAFARHLDESPDTELVLVNDGSTDGTLALLEALRDRFPERVEVLNLPANQGKAEAVRQGMLRAFERDVDLVGYLDADLATPLSAVPTFVATFAAHPGTELLLGTRVALLGREIDRKLHRHYLGRIFATFASLVLAVPIYDTQCGAKMLRATAANRRLFETRFASRWIFDVEILARYLGLQRAAGLREQPLEQWRDVAGSKVGPVDFLRAAGELLRIHHRYRLRRSPLDWLAAPFARYTGVGAFGTAMHYVVLLASVEGFGAAPLAASIAGSAVGAVVNYILNYHFTFTSDASHPQTLAKFFTVVALGMGINAACMATLTVQTGLPYLAVQLVSTAVVLVVGFFVNRAWTFRDSRG